MRQIKIGLALGAGSAKGWAHIGVINALKKLGIEVDIVAGCSVGALVGAAFASHRLPVMEQWVRSFSYWDVIRLMDFSWQRGGLLRGDRVFTAVGQLLKVNDIAECALKFGAVTTNLSTGRELWLTEGDIHQAIRASCSMPGLLAPVWADGYWLVDGAVVNPVPVSLCRALGADIVIAVDLQHDAHLMQQDLFSIRGEDERPDDTPAGARRQNAQAQTDDGADGDGDYEHIDSNAGKSPEAQPDGERSAGRFDPAFLPADLNAGFPPRR
jgi:NTE family protein